jgi:hypothetical protein
MLCPSEYWLKGQINLQVLSIAGTASEQRQAPKVLRLIRAGRHTMLVMLLLCRLGEKIPTDIRQYTDQHIITDFPGFYCKCISPRSSDS